MLISPDFTAETFLEVLLPSAMVIAILLLFIFWVASYVSNRIIIMRVLKRKWTEKKIRKRVYRRLRALQKSLRAKEKEVRQLKLKIRLHNKISENIQRKTKGSGPA